MYFELDKIIIEYDNDKNKLINYIQMTKSSYCDRDGKWCPVAEAMVEVPTITMMD